MIGANSSIRPVSRKGEAGKRGVPAKIEDNLCGKTPAFRMVGTGGYICEILKTLFISIIYTTLKNQIAPNLPL